MSIPRIDHEPVDTRTGRRSPLKDDDLLKTTRFMSSRVGLRALQAFSAIQAEKDNIALKQELFSLPDDVISGKFVESQQVEEASPVDSESEAIENASSQLQEELSNEDIFLLADPELKGFITRFQALDFFYTEAMKLFEQFKKAEELVLTGFEYGSANKDNIHVAASKLKPNQSDKIERSLDHWDICFKETNCLIHFIMGGIKYSMTLYAERGLKEHQQRAEKMKSDTQSPQPEEASSGRMQSIYQKCVDRFARKLEQDKKEIEEEVYGKIKSLKTLAPRASSIVLRAYSTIIDLNIAEKTVDLAGKTAKHVVASFLAAWSIDKIVNARGHQQAWISRLQPRLAVNVYSDPDVADDPFLNAIETTQQEVVIEVNRFLSYLRNCTSIEEVQAKFEETGIPFEGPETIDQFHDLLQRSGRFSRDIVQSYYHYTGLSQMTMNNADFKENLCKREDEYRDKINACLDNDINKHIDACQNKGLAYTKNYFEQYHIDIDSIELPDDEDELPLPPQTEAEWQECIQSEEFCRALAIQLVRYHEELARSTDQAMRQSMLSKHTVERKSLIFRGIGNSIEFLSSVIQVGLLCNAIGLISIGQRLSQSAIFLSGSAALEMFLKDISKSGIPGIGIICICCPLYANMSLKLENIILLLAEHFVNVKYKPNEYSLDGYALAVQMNVMQFAIKLRTLIFFYKQALLWLNMRLIENCVMGMQNKPFNEDPRFNQMSDSYQERTSNYEYYIEDVKAKLDALKIKDVELTMCPQLEKVRANLQNLEPLKDLTEKLDDTVNIDLFPSHVIESIEDATGFRLTNANKHQFRKHLEELLIASEAAFIKTYQDSHLAYMKAK